MTDEKNINRQRPPNPDLQQTDPAALRKQEQQKRKNIAQKSLKYTLLGILAIALALSAFIWYVFYGPRWGTMHYGVCKVFAERYIDFPTTMKVRDVEYYGLNARLFISHMDAAGQSRYNVIECEYAMGTFEVSRVRVDRRVISSIDENNASNPEILNEFNKGVDAILLNPPDLLLPRSKIGQPLRNLWQGDS